MMDHSTIKAFICQVCYGGTKVIDSRANRKGDWIRRRRECLVCKHRFTTIETAAPTHVNGRIDAATPDLLEQNKVLRRTIAILEGGGYVSPETLSRAKKLAAHTRR